MSIEPTTTQAGWYPDPNAPALQRWWNGVTWSDATRPAYAPAPQYVVPAYGQGYPVLAPRNGAATAGLTLGIICMFLNSLLLVSTPAFICSIVGLNRASQLEAAGYGPVGRTAAVWGLVLSILGALGTIFLKLFLF